MSAPARIAPAIPTPREHAAAVRYAHELFDLAVSLDERDDAIDKEVIDQVIEHHMSLGTPFSANHLREDLPAVRKALVPHRLRAFQNDGRIRKIGYTPSTLPSTHGAVVAVYEAC